MSKTSSNKICAGAIAFCLVACNWTLIWTQVPGLEAGASETLAASIPREALERLANLTQDDRAANMWILIPSNLSESQLHESNFALFKLNTGQLFDLGGEGEQMQRGHLQGWSLENSADERAPGQGASMTRAARKLGLFSNVLSKPKVSPLYLVNGTVCRFVNSQPICTTLSTTGLFRK